jgi:hypothetical protein
VQVRTKTGEMRMENIITKIFSRQYKRMEKELLGINIPEGYLSIISKYWHYAEEDIINSVESGDIDDKEQSK